MRNERPTVFVEKLPWDSDFFGFSVGRLVLPSGNVDPQIVKAAIREAGCELTYVFLPIGDEMPRDTEKPRSALVDLGGRCCDLKVTYRKQLSVDFSGKQRTVSAMRIVTPALEKLAYASGWCSRFVTDDRLRSFFKPMYSLWLKRDLECGRIFVLPTVDAPKGLATVSIQNGMGKIGLLAVDAQSCGRGLATELLREVDAWLCGQHVCECEVVTQGMNRAACRLYEKLGFAVYSQTEVWHVWRNPSA